MRTHPPLFTALCRRLSPQHPVNVLARRLAVQEDTDRRLIDQINLGRIRASVFAGMPQYRPPGYSDHHGKDER